MFLSISDENVFVGNKYPRLFFFDLKVSWEFYLDFNS
jgi:hypothetical protein